MMSKVIRDGASPMARSELVRGLRAIGVHAGGVLMVHTRMSALGWVVGGSGTVVTALLEALGPEGTLMAYAGWEDDPSDPDEWPPAWRPVIEAESPPFDPATSEAKREHGLLPERMRTWPGAQRSRQPEANVVAIGRHAAWVTADHPWDDPYGAGSPYAKLVEAEGQVLLLGAPLDTLTLLHHAEAAARVPNKRRITYRAPIVENGQPVWREFHDIDTGSGAFPYETVADPAEDAFATIARQTLAAGIGHAGRIGQGECHLFPARELHAFAVAWMERRFG